MPAGIIGVGRLGGALLRGLTRAGVPAVVYSRSEARTREQVAGLAGVEVAGSAAEVFRRCDPVCVWMDEADADALLTEQRGLIAERDPVIVTCAPNWTPDAHTTKWAATLPNVNLGTGDGGTIVAWSDGLVPVERERVRALLGAVGSVYETTMAVMDIYSALTSNGPALYAELLQVWADTVAGRHGLDRDVCRKLVLQTARGTIALQQEEAIDAAEVIRRVAHPGASTSRALAVLSDDFRRTAEGMLKAMGKW